MADDDISRLYDFTSGNVIASSEVDGELNQIVSACNGKMSRAGTNTISGTNTFSGGNTHSGSNTFSGANTFSSGLTSINWAAFPDAGEKTIATGAITVTGSYHTVDTESDAASDDLDTINGGTDGKVLVIQSEADARNVVVKHNTGNIFLGNAADFTLDTKEQSLTLVYSSALTKWIEISRSNYTTPLFTQSYVSSEQTITSAGTLDLAHGFGAKPKIVYYTLVCQNTENGYSPGDEIDVSCVDFATAATRSYGHTALIDSTNISIYFSDETNVYNGQHKSTRADANFANANWKLVVRAYY